MSESMTAKERITAALEGRPVDRLPWSPFLAYVWENFPQEIQNLGQDEFLRQVGADPLYRGAPGVARAEQPEAVRSEEFRENGRNVITMHTPVGSLRAGYQTSENGHTSFLVEHPLKTAEDFKVLTWIEEHTRMVYDDEAAAKHLREAGDRGLSFGMLVPRGKTAFQNLVEHWVGTEELIYALADFPDVVETLWSTMVARNLEAVDLSARFADHTYWITWEDSGTQNYSPGMYDRYIGSEIGQWSQRLAQAGMKYVQHACGHCRELVARMKDHGTFAVESLSPPPTGDVTLAEARAKVGAAMGIIGGIEPTEFLNQPIEQLGPYVEQVIADGAGGPFVLANSDSCPPGVTMEKFKLVGDVVRAVAKD